MENPAVSQTPERLVCSRKKDVKVFLLPSGRQFRVLAEMQDDIHHMQIEMLVNNPSLRIKEITCEMPGVPDPCCRKAVNCLQPLIDRQVGPGLTRGLQVSAEKGCTHLLNLFREACDNLLVSQGVLGREYYTEMFPGISEEQLYHIFLWFRPQLENSCVRYADKSPFMEKVRNVELPAGAEKFRAVAKGMGRKPKD
jgi:hypothetical protein